MYIRVNGAQIRESFVPPLFDAVLFDYASNVPAAREPEVLHMITVFVNKLKVLSPMCHK